MTDPFNEIANFRWASKPLTRPLLLGIAIRSINHARTGLRLLVMR